MSSSGVSNCTLTSCSGIKRGAGLFLVLAISAFGTLPEAALSGRGATCTVFSGVCRSIPGELVFTGSTFITPLLLKKNERGRDRTASIPNQCLLEQLKY